MSLKFEVLQRVLGLHNRFCYKRGCKPSDRFYDNQTVRCINLRFSWLKNSIFFFNEMRPSRKKVLGIVVNNAVGIPFYQVNEREIIIARASVASESNTTLAMHLGAIAL